MVNKKWGKNILIKKMVNGTNKIQTFKFEELNRNPMNFKVKEVGPFNDPLSAKL